MNGLSAGERIARAKARFADLRLGDSVPVTRYGRQYNGTVTYVGTRGLKRATFSYGNGNKRTVVIDWGEFLTENFWT